MKSKFIKTYLSSSVKILILPVMSLCLFVLLSNAASQYESPRALKAADILPPDLISGKNFRVDPMVVNDGYMNMYTVKSDFGQIKVTSTAALKVRVREFDAIHAMTEVEKTDSYKQSLEKAGKNTLSGVKDIVTNPVKSVKGAVSGVGRMFQRAGESIKSKSGAGEDNSFEQLIGFSESKREIAKEFGVDVYSPNKILQERLEAIAWASFGGKMSLTIVKAFVPGGVGIVLSVSDNTKMLNEAIMSTPPSELKLMNRKKLNEMGIDSRIIELFMDNSKFTPRYQTQLVAALDEMKGAEGRELFMQFAALTDTEDVAFFRQRSAMKYAVYHRKKAPIKRFVSLDQFAAGCTKDTLVFIIPVDYLIWTENTARIAEALDQKIKTMPEIKQRELWLSGSVSPSSRERLTSMGWKIFENDDKDLLPDIQLKKS